MKNFFISVLLSCLGFSSFSQTKAKQDTLVINANEYTKAFNLHRQLFFTGNGIKVSEKKDTAWSTYSIKVPDDNFYYFHILGSLDNPVRVEDNPIHLVTNSEKLNTKAVAKTILLSSHATVWTSLATPFLLTKGGNIIAVSLSGLRQQYIERIIITTDKNFKPTGTGMANGAIKPILPPAWAFGVLYGGYTNQQKTREVIDSLISGDFPVDAYWIDSWFWDFETEGKGPKGYMNFMEDKIAFPDTKEMWSYMERQKIKAGVWMWNCIQREGNEAVFDSFYQKKYLTTPEINKDSWHNKTKLTINADVDFSNPDAVNYWKGALRPQFDQGLDFLKLDRSSAIDYCKAAFEAAQEMGKETKGRGFILNHLMISDDPRFKLYPTKWSGDAKISWQMPDYPNYGIPAIGGLKENVLMLADPKRSTYEIPFLTHDGGGYDYFGSKDFSDELYTRWAQFSCFSPITTFFSTSNNPSRNHPYWFNDAVQNNVRKYMHLRMKLFPYIYSYAHKVHDGERFITGDGIYEHQYLFGNEILVAPIVTKGATQQTVFLPAGDWLDFESLEIYKGNQTITVEAPLYKLPLFVRAGAIIPMRNYARAVELGTSDSLTVRIFPLQAPGTSMFKLYEDDGISNDYLRGGRAITQIEAITYSHGTVKVNVKPINGSYDGMKPVRYVKFEVQSKHKPKSVILNGKKIRFSYLSQFILFELASEKSKKTELDILY